jgi:serine/threonine protein kinase/Tol biopolymer transport system component
MIGQTISHYKILGKLGEGGMGVVYKAQDTKLDRLVALKFLPPHLSASEQDKARFIQEAKAASALNHPNVCTIHDIQEHDKQMFIVMELVEGQTLRDKGMNIPLKQAIEIGVQLAEGLAAAHEKGIVHRDIKPENIMVRKDGRVQIMDFGLAKLRQASGASRLTKEGSTIGTIGYMSPEQVQGQETDHRTDIYSLGVLLYELISGQSPYKGVHETAIMYEIVNEDPAPLSSVKPETDAELDAMILDCLAKDPADRVQSAAELARNLRRFKRESSRQRVSRTRIGIPAMPREAPTQMRNDQNSFERVPKSLWVVMAGLLLSTIVAGVYILRDRDSAVSAEVVRAFVPLPEAHTITSIYGGGHLAISPDGHKIAFVVADSVGRRDLWVRPLNALSATMLSGTEGASFPFWSPDNRYIGFFSGGKMKRIEASGGPPLSICDLVDPRGASWGKNGVIVFPTDQTVGISQVPDAGGVPKQITSLDSTRNEQTHRWPYFLPDGNHFLYFARTTAVGSGSALDAVYVASLDGTVNKRLLAGTSNIAYASGYLLYMRESSLMAHSFDPDALELRGDPFPIAEAVQFNLRYSIATFSVSNTGVLVYQGQSSTSTPELALVDLKGKKTVSLKEAEIFVSARLSQDARRIAMDLYHTGARNSDVWLYEIDRGVNTRFTFDPSVDWYPIWSPDGNHVVFSSRRKDHYDLYQKVSSGATNEQLLFESPYGKIPSDWSPDGKFVLFHSINDPQTKTDIWVLPTSGDRKPTPFLQTEYSESDARFSRDMKWIAYQSDESGRTEIYVRPFPGADAKWQVSTNGGRSPRWHRNGKEIFFLNGVKVMAVEVGGSGSTFQIGRVREHFDPTSMGGISIRDISAEGERILLQISSGQEGSTPLTLVFNWLAETRKK